MAGQKSVKTDQYQGHDYFSVDELLSQDHSSGARCRQRLGKAGSQSDH